MQQARAQKFTDVAVFDRSGLTAGRPAQAIGFASVRAGSIVGDHTVLLASDEEVLELTHRATDRALFARGALRAAAWLEESAGGPLLDAGCARAFCPLAIFIRGPKGVSTSAPVV